MSPGGRGQDERGIEVDIGFSLARARVSWACAERRGGGAHCARGVVLPPGLVARGPYSILSSLRPLTSVLSSFSPGFFRSVLLHSVVKLCWSIIVTEQRCQA